MFAVVRPCVLVSPVHHPHKTVAVEGQPTKSAARVVVGVVAVNHEVLEPDGLVFGKPRHQKVGARGVRDAGADRCRPSDVEAHIDAASV